MEGVAWTSYRRQNCTAAYGCVNPWREIYYDDPQALGLKYDVINRYNLRGAGIWALGYDGTRPGAHAMLKDKFVTDTIPPRISSAIAQHADHLAQRRRAARHHDDAGHVTGHVSSAGSSSRLTASGVGPRRSRSGR